MIDSSRYFVIKFLDPRAAAAVASKSGGSSSNKSSRSTYLGVGFRERDQAFDFKNCLNDYTKFIDRMALAGQMAQGELEGGAVGAERGEGAEGGGHEVEQVGGQDVATSKVHFSVYSNIILVSPVVSATHFETRILTFRVIRLNLNTSSGHML